MTREEKLGHKIFIARKEKSYLMKFIISKDVHNFVNSINKNLY
ncbi:hypothetical protein [Clostridium sp.]